MKRSPMARHAPLRRDQGEAKATVPLRKPRRCNKAQGGCGGLFVPRRAMQAACTPPCAQAMAATAREKAEARAKLLERRADKAKREAMEKLPELRERAQLAFRAYIRKRDAGKPCICCGRTSSGAGRDRGGEWDAGHYRSRGACPELAFDERNCHAQTKYCNRRSWDVATYRANLIERIGLAEVLELEGPHPPKHYTHDDFRAMAADYRRRARELEKA